MKNKLHQAIHYLKHTLVATRKGHGVHSPFAYRLCEEVFYNRHPFYAFEHLAAERKKLLQDKHLILMKDFGAGSNTFRSNERRVCDICRHGISSKKQSEILYRLINFLQSKTIVELGTSIGLNTMYLASVHPGNHVVSIDACDDLIAYARQLSKANNLMNITFMCDMFDGALPTVLQKYAPFDLVYIDGNHSYEATVAYFHTLLQCLHQDAVIVFDDIYWRAGMTKAWQEIKSHPAVKLSIDTYHSGYVFFKEELKEQQHFRFWV